MDCVSFREEYFPKDVFQTMKQTQDGRKKIATIHAVFAACTLNWIQNKEFIASLYKQIQFSDNLSKTEKANLFDTVVRYIDEAHQQNLYYATNLEYPNKVPQTIQSIRDETYFLFLINDFNTVEYWSDIPISQQQKLQFAQKLFDDLHIDTEVARNRSSLWVQRKSFEEYQKCNNDVTIVGYDPVQDIDPEYFYFVEENNVRYCFDLRELKQLLRKSNKNPYTNVEFTKQQLEDIQYWFEFRRL